MEPILNFTPQVYEAIIAAFIVIGLLQTAALRRKWHQAEKLKSTLKSVITEATKAVMTGAMFGAIQVAKAKAETRKIAKLADETIDALTDRIAELEDELADDDEPGETRFPFGSPGSFAGVADDPFANLRAAGFSPTGRRLDPLASLLGSLGRNAGGRGAPTIHAFKITPRGLEPVNGPEDFGLEGVTTNTRPTPGGERRPSLADILSLLATLPTPPRRRSPFDDLPDALKADLASDSNLGSGVPGDFLHDEHGPAAPGDAYVTAAEAARASVAGTGEQPNIVEAEACDTQRAPEASQSGNSHDRRVPRHDDDGFTSQSPRAG